MASAEKLIHAPIQPTMKAISALSLALFVVANAHAADSPNIVFIFIDDAAYSDFHPFGNIRMPRQTWKNSSPKACAMLCLSAGIEMAQPSKRWE
jgi:hypothetical protein